jgi:integrase/recombinase XerD
LAAIRLGQLLNADKRVNAEFKLSGDQTKGRHPRTIYLSDALREELQTYIDLRGDYEPTHLVFVTAGGKPFTAAVMTQHLYWLFRKAGIDGASSHTLRRQFITKLASKGIGIKILATMAGHRSIQVTAKYIDTNPDMLRNAANLA